MNMAFESRPRESKIWINHGLFGPFLILFGSFRFFLYFFFSYLCYIFRLDFVVRCLIPFCCLIFYNLFFLIWLGKKNGSTIKG
jgi:hypothetical protein